MADTAVRALSMPEIKTHWRDIIELDIKDPALKGRVEGFLNYLENHAFKYDLMDPRTKKITTKELSGQEILGKLVATKHEYDEGGLSQALSRSGIMKNNKFVIAQHDRLWDGHEQNGSTTLTARFRGRNWPLRIEIGPDYLKGALFTDVDGKKRPVTVDGVIAHELAHLAYASPDEVFAGQIEGIISTALGGYQRNDSHMVDFKRGGNGGYVTLYDKAGRSPRAMDFNERASPVLADILAPQASYAETAPSLRPSGMAA